MQERNIQLLSELKSQIEQLAERDLKKIDAIKLRANLLIGKIFGEDSNYRSLLKSISFSPTMYISPFGSPSSVPYDRAWEKGISSFINIVNTMIEDIELSVEFNKNESSQINSLITSNNQIFIVHGHNEEMKQSVARLIEKLDLKPLILHELANKGRTIIQKFIDHSNVGFAIVLMSADDYGFSKNDIPENAKLRARQNVILELGFFIGKLGAERVMAIFEKTDNFEIPSDMMA
jgi:hypothetical protein